MPSKVTPLHSFSSLKSSSCWNKNRNIPLAASLAHIKIICFKIRRNVRSLECSADSQQHGQVKGASSVSERARRSELKYVFFISSNKLSQTRTGISSRTCTEASYISWRKRSLSPVIWTISGLYCDCVDSVLF